MCCNGCDGALARSYSWCNMLKSLLQWFIRSAVPVRRETTIDSLLGVLVPGEDGWTARVSRGDDEIEFTIGGKNQPDPALLAHAHDILNHYETFKESVRNCIRAESRDYPEDVKAQLAALQIDNISLCWPTRPDDGMIFFRGSGDDIGLWRCDYVARTPQRLACDT